MPIINRRFLVKAAHSWDTLEACYGEIVNVKKGYGVVEYHDTLGVMRTRGYDIVTELHNGDSFDFDTCKVVRKKVNVEDNQTDRVRDEFVEPQNQDIKEKTEEKPFYSPKDHGTTLDPTEAQEVDLRGD